MTITQQPQDFSPTTKPILFAFSEDEECDVEVYIIDEETSETIGHKMLRKTATGAINIAPYIREVRDSAPKPLVEHSTLVPAPYRQYRVEINGTSSLPVSISDNQRQPTLPSLLTTMGSRRHIARGEQDELRIYSDAGAKIEAILSADNGECIDLTFHTATGATLFLFRPDDFAETAKRIFVDIVCDGKRLQSLEYEVTEPQPEARRIAWRSFDGSIEHYTFPVVEALHLAAQKEQSKGSSGATTLTRTSSHSHLFLGSAIEPRATIAALAEVVAAEQCWLLIEGCYEPVAVVTSEVVMHRFGTPCSIAIEVETAEKEVARW